MKLIILAAWQGSRLRPLTNTVPKPLIKIFWKPIVEHNLENIITDENKKLFDEIIFIVKYKQEKIKEYFKDEFNWVKITYITQWDKKWTWWALMWLDIQDDVFIINWDNIFSKKDLDKIVNCKNYAVLAKKVEDPSKYGIFKLKDNDFVDTIIEKPKEFVWDLANLWVYKLWKEFFEYVEKTPLSPRWEYEIIDPLNTFAKHFKVKALKIDGEFIDVGYVWDILSANAYFLKNLKDSVIKWTIEENVVIKWNIVLEEWAILKNWTYIEWNCYFWKNTVVWPNVYIRWNTCIWDNCKIWANNEIKNTTIWDNTNIAHLSYLWDSVIWNNVNIAWWFISANLRHDGENVKVLVKWELKDTGLRKFWVVIWDNVKTWVNTYSLPWRVVENNKNLMPWIEIK